MVWGLGSPRNIIIQYPSTRCWIVKIWKLSKCIEYTSYGQCSLFGDFIFQPSDDENRCWIDGEHGEYYYPLSGSLGHANGQYSWSHTDRPNISNIIFSVHIVPAFVHFVPHLKDNFYVLCFSISDAIMKKVTLVYRAPLRC